MLLQRLDIAQFNKVFSTDKEQPLLFGMPNLSADKSRPILHDLRLKSLSFKPKWNKNECGNAGVRSPPHNSLLTDTFTFNTAGNDDADKS